MADILLKLMGFAPDAEPTIVGVLTQVEAVVPTLKGLKGAPTPVATPLASLAATCQGSAVLVKLDGTTRMLAGTGQKLYEAGTSTWTDVSRAATYTASTTARWRFAQSNNVSIAVDGADTMQASVSTGPFSCIAGAPIAKIVEVVGSFVFAFNLSTNAHGWQCSANGNYASWTTAAATQATSGTLQATPGEITAGRRFGNAIIAYKKTSMYAGVYVGAPNVWEFTQIPGDAGAMSQEAVVNIGTPENPKHIFMGADDFYLYDGTKPATIGTNRVKEAVFGALLQSRFYTCAALHDRRNSLVYFYYPTLDSYSPSNCVVYNYRTDRWGVDDRPIEAVAEYVAPGFTFDSLGGSYATFDNLPELGHDAAFLSSAQLQPAIFDSSHRIKTLTGPSDTSSFTIGDVGNDSDFFTLTRVRPRFTRKPTSATWTNFYRNDLGDPLTTDGTTTLTNGTFDFIRDARWHRGRMDLVGDWELSVIAAQGEKGGLE